ncbi:sigma-70 family RNA polymerase sigma factor [Rugosimonospora africana]|uniref:sigma-70 family RNA polymerase sigma factor n=1 Tax=Rugosimonospora africana TaxID=556532 RepID=UPI0019405B7A|nr:sigma-70 family RNA polymerase sigma factor [Rugosimonospora africana]
MGDWVDTGWEEVYAGHYSRLVALLTALAGSRAEAEEAVQEAFVRALGMSGRRAVVEDPEAWLYRVAVNLLRSRWRRVLAGRRAVARLSAPDEVVTEDSGRVDDRVRLLGALRRLPFEQREAIALHYLADMPVEAVAVRVGSPIGTVKARLSRGRNALARLLGEAPVGGGSRHA